MSGCSQLPIWVSLLQALAVPLVAVVGVWIAAQQMLIAYDKLQHDTFGKTYDRRVAVYEATREFLADASQGNISEDKIRIYGLKTLDAQFLFDDRLYKYLKKVRLEVAAWNHTNSAAEREPHGDNRNEHLRIRDEKSQWILEQGDEKTGFAAKFISFLVYRQVRRPWPLRWPWPSDPASSNKG